MLPLIPVEDALAPPFARQGIGVPQALFELGLVSEAFYDTICAAETSEIATLAQWWGDALPADYLQFLKAAGGSLGTLRIKDWRTVWDFRPAKVLDHVLGRPEAERRGLRQAGRLPIALLGPTMEEGYDHPVCLTYDLATGVIVPEDSDRRSYSSLASLLLEWGNRLLEPRMAVPLHRLRAWDATRLSPGHVRSVLDLAESQLGPEGQRHVGGWLGVYRFRQSGLILRLDGPRQLWVEGYARRRTNPSTTAAAAVLGEGRDRGLLQP